MLDLTDRVRVCVQGGKFRSRSDIARHLGLEVPSGRGGGKPSASPGGKGSGSGSDGRPLASPGGKGSGSGSDGRPLASPGGKGSGSGSDGRPLASPGSGGGTAVGPLSAVGGGAAKGPQGLAVGGGGGAAPLAPGAAAPHPFMVLSTAVPAGWRGILIMPHTCADPLPLPSF